MAFFNWLRILAFCAVGALAAAGAGAKVDLAVEAGWDGMYKSGAWAPIFITATDSDANPARNVRLEIVSDCDLTNSVRVSQSFAISRDKTVRVVYVPIYFQAEDIKAILYDAASGKVLAENSMAGAGGPFSNRRVYYGGGYERDMLLAVSGKGKMYSGLSNVKNWTWEASRQPQPYQDAPLEVGFLPESHLPSSPIGFDGITMLTLNAPDLTKMPLDRQQAIVQWVRAGGKLLIWPGDKPMPPDSPITGILPCTVGSMGTLAISLQETQKAGLYSRVEKIAARELAGREDAKKLNMLEGKGALWTRDEGLGTVGVLSFDPTGLVFTNINSERLFWLPIFSQVIQPEKPLASDVPRFQYGVTGAEQRRTLAMDTVVEHLAGDVPGVGRFDFSYVAIVLAAMMLIVGPLDWFVLKKIGRQPWTWFTITGWIGLVTFSALYIGHVFKSGDLYYRTLRIVDEADGRPVASRDLCSIYSPTTQGYTLSGSPDQWWRPTDISTDLRYGWRRQHSRSTFELGLSQTPRGTTPGRMPIKVWDLRFVEAESTDAGSRKPIIEASLRKSPPIAGKPQRLVGQITNHSDQPLTKLRIRANGGVFGPSATVDSDSKAGRDIIAPHQTLDIDFAFVPNDPALTPPDLNKYEPYGSRSPYAAGAVPGFALMRASHALTPERASRINELLRQNDIGCIFAESELPAAPIKMTNERNIAAIEKHIQIVRAIVHFK